MRFIILICLFTALFSCNHKKQEANISAPDYLSKWFIANEDSLYKEFVSYVSEDITCKSCDTSWGEMAYQKVGEDSYMGRFSLETKRYCDSLEVTYFYNKTANPKCRILVSTAYNKRLTHALDTLLIFPFAPKYFNLQKYEQRNKSTDIYSLGNTDVVVKDLRLHLVPIDTLYDLTVYINAKPSSGTLDLGEKDFFIRSIFGEELLLKKINKVWISFNNRTDPNFLTLEEAILKLSQ